MVGDELVGRDEALARLRAAVDGAAAGRGGLVLVAGEPGIGKTALVTRATEHSADAGVGLLWATCWDGAGAPAYWPWVQVVRSYFRTCDETTLRTQLGARAGEIGRFAGEVGGVSGEFPVPADRDPDRARFRLFDAVSSFLVRAAADRPLCVVIDDLQWADASSLLLLGFLARQLSGSALMIIGCYRDTEVGPGHPLRALLGEVGRSRELIELPGLDRGGVARLIAQVGGADPGPDLVKQVFARTAGNPFFVREVTRLLASRGDLDRVDGRAGVPEGVRQVVEQRLARLPQPCTDLLAVAAVAGQEVGAGVLARAMACAPAAVVELTEHAVRARVLAEPATASGPYRFAHDLFREIVYDGLPAPVRAGLHRRVGDALEELRGTGAQVGAAELAHHLLLAAIGSDPASVTDVSTAVGYCISAAEESIGRLSYEDAIGHYRRALDGLAMAGVLSSEHQQELLLGLGNARRATGDIDCAHTDYRLAADLARRTRDGTGLARAALGTVALGLVSGTAHDTAIALLEEALAALGTAEDDLRARVLAGLARAVYHTLDDDDTRAAELSRAALDLARRGGVDSTLVECLLARHDALWYPGTAPERRALADEMAEVARRVSDRELAAEACLLRATAALELGERRFGRDIEEFVLLATELRQPRWTYLALTRRGDRGHHDRAPRRGGGAARRGRCAGREDRRAGPGERGVHPAVGAAQRPGATSAAGALAPERLTTAGAARSGVGAACARRAGRRGSGRRRRCARAGPRPTADVRP